VGTKKDKKKKNRGKSLTASEQRQMEIKIRGLIGKGKNGAEIMEDLHLQPHIFMTYLSRIKDIDRDDFQKITSVDVYTTAIEKSRTLVKELQSMRKRFDYRKQFTALVASIKQEHEINKDVVKLGQELGFVEKKGAEVSVETELLFSTMTTEQVLEEVQNEIERINHMAMGKDIIMRPELIEALGDNPDQVQKYVPDYIQIDKDKHKKKVKVKTKIKLKKRM